MIASPVFYAQISWPRLEGYMTKKRKNAIIKHCAYRYVQEGLLVMFAFAVMKLVQLTPAGWGWDCLLAMAAGQAAGLFLLLPVMLISTKYVNN